MDKEYNNYPVDIVYTWVDGSDKNWIAKKNNTLKAYSSFHKSEEVSGDERFLDNEELKYSLRSIHKFCPWVQNIYLVTDEQTPNWLNQSNTNLKIIDHKELFEREETPCFNSNAIEMKLHHINNLSENFLSFNDDFFIGRPTKKSDFFHDYNIPKLFMSKIKEKRNPDRLLNIKSLRKDNPHQRAVLNSRNLIHKKYGTIITQDLRHSVKSLNKKILFELEQKFSDVFKETLKNQFRDNSDTWIMSLHAFYLISKKITSPFYMAPIRRDLLRYRFFFLRKGRDYVFIPLTLTDNKIQSKFDAVMKYTPLTFCVNDSPGATMSAKRISINNLKKIFPEKSIYEK